MPRSISLFIAALFLLAPLGNALADTAELDAGPLDRPLSIDGETGVTTSLRPSSVSVDNPIQSQEALREAVVEEQEILEKLPREELETKAEQGERAAQVVLGADFAREATLLSFAPAAANDALSDAARWYSLAASRGFPGAPSLDQSGIRFFPIRVQRDPAP
ncbi:hypothetical protein ACUNV4_13350 [Granulosicoccus sp. 3-233]|uniref:hypothetical protein n=1 Tax=Granulosicoccus sp. 3-233 TaxID=3417969 RepID=UPI003D33F58D